MTGVVFSLHPPPYYYQANSGFTPGALHGNGHQHADTEGPSLDATSGNDAGKGGDWGGAKKRQAALERARRMMQMKPLTLAPLMALVGHGHFPPLP
jgi:hypothetical protein